jgi:hypothetical protein
MAQVSEDCQYSGTVFFLHFDLLHRATRNFPTAIWRNMMKLQFCRTSAPTAPSWAHTCGDEVDPFGGHTGAGGTPQKAVWEAVWQWLRGSEHPFPPPAPLPHTPGLAITNLGGSAGSPPDEREAAALERHTETLLRSTHERERVGSAYALAKLGGAAGLAQLQHALLHGSEDSSRTALYGLAAMGDAAVPGLLAALQRSSRSQHAGAWVLPNAAHALTDALRRPSPAVLDTLRTTLMQLAQEMAEAVAAELLAQQEQQQQASASQLQSPTASFSHGAKYAVRAVAERGLDHPAVACRYGMACCIQALGTLGERAVSRPAAQHAHTHARAHAHGCPQEDHPCFDHLAPDQPWAARRQALLPPARARARCCMWGAFMRGGEMCHHRRRHTVCVNDRLHGRHRRRPAADGR